MKDLPTEMNAAFIRQLGGPEEIEIGRMPVPRCGPDDVLARVEAAAVNHIDTFVRSGAYATELPMPFIIGRDFVGEVVATGDRVTNFAPGDRVWCNSLGYAGRQGCFADYAAAPAERVHALPPGQDPATTATLLHTAATACIGLFREGDLRDGDAVFVGGAGGGVGSATVQLAAAHGARVVATAADYDHDWVASCGAYTVIDYRDPDAAEKIARAAPDGFDLYWDNSGHHDFDAILPCMARGGRIILAAGLQARPELPVGAVYTRDASLRGFAISNASTADLARAADRVNQALRHNHLTARISHRLPLSEAARAHALQEGRDSTGARGRIVVLP